MQNERHSTIQESPANHTYFNFILCMKAILFIRQRHGLNECAKYKTEWTDYNCHICYWLEFYWNIKYTHDVAFQYEKKHEKKVQKKDCFFLLSHTTSTAKLFTSFRTKSKFRYKMHHIWIQQGGQEEHNFTLKWMRAKAFYLVLRSLLGIGFGPNLFLLDLEKLLCRKPNNKSLHVIFPIEFECFAFVFFFELINWFYK